jgi:hypothetical protein
MIISYLISVLEFRRGNYREAEYLVRKVKKLFKIIGCEFHFIAFDIIWLDMLKDWMEDIGAQRII